MSNHSNSVEDFCELILWLMQKTGDVKNMEYPDPEETNIPGCIIAVALVAGCCLLLFFA